MTKACVKRDNGILKVDINGELFLPLSFKSFRANPRNISEFYNAGVRLFSVLFGGITSALGVPYSLFGDSWIGEGQYDFSPIDRQMDMFLENAPNGYFAPMIQLDTRDWFLASHPEVPNSFTHLSQTAHCEEWRRQAAEYMRAVISHCEEKYGDRIYGYFLLCGTTTEWFSERDYEAPHPIKENGFKQWTGNENAVLPSRERLSEKGNVFLTADDDDVYMARKFHSETISGLIGYFTKEAQSEIQHQKLLGLYYGYLFELGGERLYNDGALDYESVFLSEDIDMISSPSAYGYRSVSAPSAFMVTQKTLDAHNKLYFLEFDHITHVAPEEINDDSAGGNNHMMVKIPGANSKCKDEIESLNLMYRDFVMTTANGCALWWFDMFDGWFRSEGMMNAVAKMIELRERLGEYACENAAEIAVFAEGSSMYRARKNAGLATACLSNIRRTLAECGAPYDLYSICDLDAARSPRYKLILFINQYDIPDLRKEQISTLLSKSGKTAVWFYAPNYATDRALKADEISRQVGINVRETERPHGALVYNGNRYSCELNNAPYFSVDDPIATPLAYFEDGSVAAALKDNNVYVATCNLPSDMLRYVAEQAGVFIYSRDNATYTYVNSQIIGVYRSSDQAKISVTSDGIWKDLISGKLYSAKNGTITLDNAEMRVYMLEKYREDKKK